MTEETKQDTEATETTETTEQATGSNQNNQQAKFSQEDVNKLISREKAAWKRSHDKVVGDHETIVEGLRKDIQSRDELIQAQVDLLKKDLELSATEKLLLDKLSGDPLEQFKTITEMIEARGKQDAQFPRTPSGKRKEPEFQSKFNANL